MLPCAASPAQPPTGHPPAALSTTNSLGRWQARVYGTPYILRQEGDIMMSLCRTKAGHALCSSGNRPWIQGGGRKG